MALTARRHTRNDADLAEVLTLIRTAFAYMDGVIDPPSSVHHLTLADLRRHCAHDELWSLGPPLAACVLLKPEPDALHIGKLAVCPDQQGRGHARRLVGLAEKRAKALHLPALDLQSRVELTRNHTVFASLGFEETARTAHPGFPRPTSIRFRKRLA